MVPVLHARISSLLFMFSANPSKVETCESCFSLVCSNLCNTHTYCLDLAHLLVVLSRTLSVFPTKLWLMAPTSDNHLSTDSQINIAFGTLTAFLAVIGLIIAYATLRSRRSAPHPHSDTGAYKHDRDKVFC